MKHEIRMLALAMSLGAITVAHAADTAKKPREISKQAAVKVSVDQKTGRIAEFNPNDPAFSSVKRADVADVLSKRLSVPKVTVIKTAKTGGDMMEIGLDEMDFLVATVDENGKPVVTHRSSVNHTVTAEEK